jgi:anion-transporting  ArsA/GET3 family ATPase
MSLAARLTSAMQSIAADIKNLISTRGNLSSLTTTDKTSLVNSINEVNGLIGSIAEIDDNAATSSTTKTYSANKLTTLLNNLKTSILGSASPAYDTLQELQALLEGDASAISGLLTAVNNRIAYDASQSLNTTQQATACANIGVGNPEIDLVAIYNTAKA